MKKLNRDTEKAKSFIRNYWASSNITLRDCYGRYSKEKEAAERSCRAIMHKEGGCDFRIISYNTFGFTCGWRTKTSTDLRIETPKNSYIIPKIILPF